MIQVSFSGGRSSAMMAKIMLENYDRKELIFMFANTGRELPQTLDFVNECDIRWGLNMIWVEYCPENKFKVVRYETAAREGEPFEALITKRKYLPNRVARFCTSDLKVNPMRRYLKSIGIKTYHSAIGIRYDEQNRYRRLKQAKQDVFTYLFPLVEFKTTQDDVIKFWENQSFDLGINSVHSNCDFCMMKGLPKKVAQAKIMPERVQWWIDMEQLIGSRFRADYSMKDVLVLAQQRELFPDKPEPEISCFCGD
jgi:hypothetical protein